MPSSHEQSIKQESNAQTFLGYGRFTTWGLGYIDFAASTCYTISKGKNIVDEAMKEEDLIIDLQEALMEFEEDC